VTASHVYPVPVEEAPGMPRGHASKKNKDAPVTEAERIIKDRDWDRDPSR